MFYIYIIYSASADRFYVGYSSDPYRRLLEHNTTSLDTYTSRRRPWIMKAIFECGPIEAEAMKIERFIKNQKSRKLVELLCDPAFTPTGNLAQLVRVPHMRD